MPNVKMMAMSQKDVEKGWKFLEGPDEHNHLAE